MYSKLVKKYRKITREKLKAKPYKTEQKKKIQMKINNIRDI